MEKISNLIRNWGKIVEDNWKEKLCPYPFYGEESNAYGQIRITEFKFDGESGVTIRVNISLLNQKMISLEMNSLESNNINIPLFFYEFEGEHTFEISNNYRESIHRYDSKYGYFSRIKIIPIEQFNRNIYENDNLIYFEGDILFSASPIVSNKCIIVIEKGAIPTDDWIKIQKIFDIWDRNIREMCITDVSKIETKLNDLFNTAVSSANIDIYNVAQANCICCTINDKKFMYDIGITRNTEDRESENVQVALAEINRLEVEAVLLSHWDLDHILGVCYNQSCLVENLWIVPDFMKLYDKIPLSVKRLCNYLLTVGKSTVCLIDTESRQKNYFTSSDNKISIYLGTPKATYGISRSNNGGILLRIENQKAILMPGDCENTIIPSSATSKELDYFVVPHHGSNMSDPCVKGKICETTIAYVSRGKHPGHCNYDIDIDKKYKLQNFKYICDTINLGICNVKYSIEI